MTGPPDSPDARRADIAIYGNTITKRRASARPPARGPAAPRGLCAPAQVGGIIFVIDSTDKIRMCALGGGVAGSGAG